MTSSRSSKSGWRVYADSTSWTVTLQPATELKSSSSSEESFKKQDSFQDRNPSTKRFARSLEEAFPDSIERAQWWYPPEPHQPTVLEMFLWAVGISMWIGLAYYFANL